MKVVAFTLAVLVLVLPVLSREQNRQVPTAVVETISCRALEVHTDDTLRVNVIVFHQRDEGQRSQLTELLREHSGAMVEIQTAAGTWRSARMVRLKSCFGRGLLILPAPAPVSERAGFILRLAR